MRCALRVVMFLAVAVPVFAQTLPADPRAPIDAAIAAIKARDKAAFKACFDTAPAGADQVDLFFDRMTITRQLQDVAEYAFGTADLNFLPEMNNQQLRDIKAAYKQGQMSINGDKGVAAPQENSGLPTLKLLRQADGWKIDPASAFPADAAALKHDQIAVAAMKEVIVAIKAKQLWSNREAAALLDKKIRAAEEVPATLPAATEATKN